MDLKKSMNSFEIKKNWLSDYFLTNMLIGFQNNYYAKRMFLTALKLLIFESAIHF